MTTESRLTIPRVAVYGVGLIGGSLVKALRKNTEIEEVIGVGRSKENLILAKEHQVIDSICHDPVEAAERADIIVLATPVSAFADILGQIAPMISNDKIVTDVGSVKGQLIQSAESILGAYSHRFVPAHPIAGKEKSGVGEATADLFVNHNVAVTPNSSTDPDALEFVKNMWRQTGANIVEMDADVHDRVLSITSHLPHVLAYAMVKMFSSTEDIEMSYQMAAGGFYDFTRIASSDTEMWRDIVIMNKDILARHIDQYNQELTDLKNMILNADATALDQVFDSAKSARSLLKEKRKPT